MWPTAWLNSNHADVLTFSMILMLINIQVRALDLSGDSVFRHESHDLTSPQQLCPPIGAFFENPPSHPGDCDAPNSTPRLESGTQSWVGHTSEEL